MVEKVIICYTGNISKEPIYGSAGASGADVKADLNTPLCIKPGQRILIPTGLRLAVPSGYEIQIRPRSGLALKKGLTVLNSPGTIDSDYRGELGVILVNLGSESVIIEPGERIAQMVVTPVVRAIFENAESLPDSVRGDGGFGSTGHK